MRFMTTTELCASTGLTAREVQDWLDNGLLEAEMLNRAAGGRRREFTTDQLERARLVKALHRKGVPLSRLAPPTWRSTPARRSSSTTATSCGPAGMRRR